MTDLLTAVGSLSLPTLLTVLILFGFAPGFCLRLLVCLYPRTDPRRSELVAELYSLPRIERPIWVAEQLEVALFEGTSHRVKSLLLGIEIKRVRRQIKRARNANLRSGRRFVAGRSVTRSVRRLLQLQGQRGDAAGSLEIFSQSSTLGSGIDYVVRDENENLILIQAKHHRRKGRA